MTCRRSIRVDTHDFCCKACAKGVFEKMRFVAFALIVISMVAAPTSSDAQTAEHPNYPVLVLDREDGVIAIAGEIDYRTPLAFEKALSTVPNASVLILDSPGGGVHSALSVATRVRNLGLATFIPDGSRCMSACAFIFLAGTERLAWGELGVHQISQPDGNSDLVSGQFALADVIEALDEFDAPPEMIGLMLRTPPERIYTLTSDEKERFGFLATAKPDAKRETPRGGVDLSDPATWRGYVITGQLVSSGKEWYAALNTDGTTVFQFASGKRSTGRYFISDGNVCFKLDDNADYSCRRPVRGPSGIRWYDEKGSYQSVIARVDKRSFPPAARETDSSKMIGDYISPGECALIVASRPTVSEAQRFVIENVADRRFLKAFRAKNGWIAISIGTLKPDEVESVIADWKGTGRIPPDSYCSTGKNYTDIVNLGFD